MALYQHIQEPAAQELTFTPFYHMQFSTALILNLTLHFQSFAVSIHVFG